MGHLLILILIAAAILFVVVGGIIGSIFDGISSFFEQQKKSTLKRHQLRSKEQRIVAEEQKRREEAGFRKLENENDYLKEYRRMSLEDREKRQSYFVERTTELKRAKLPLKKEINQTIKQLSTALGGTPKIGGTTRKNKDHETELFVNNPALGQESTYIEYYQHFLSLLLTTQAPIRLDSLRNTLLTPPTEPTYLPVSISPTLTFEKVPAKPDSEETRFWEGDSFNELEFAAAVHTWEALNFKQCQAIEQYKRELEQINAAKVHNRYKEDAYRSNLKSFDQLMEDYGNLAQSYDSYLAGDVSALEAIVSSQINNLGLPAHLSTRHEIATDPNSATLCIDYWLPRIEEMTFIRELKFLKTKQEFKTIYATERQARTTYDDFIFQVCLGLIDFCFTVDSEKLVSTVAFNGIVEGPNEATGIVEKVCILSVMVSREEFEQIDLAHVKPKECFKKLKGVASSHFHTETAVRPILDLKRTDKRFVESEAVIEGLGEGTNLASMPWQDFETLIRDLFAKEFASDDAEVKVTRASKDGGVDAVALDPDPIKGGKFVIQAKRYTNVVGLSAVRDLYGTVMNEGANRGILVTTSNYGRDAYEFAKDKPLTLINGSELLHLLKKHGYQARVDIKEAKRLLNTGS